jgi:tRNA pseudouridine38-40 synthase
LNYFFQIKEELDIELMKEATKLFLGEHDFSSYAKSPDKYHITVRKILRAELVEKDDLLIFDVIGTGFMRNMVRNMAKVLYLVGLKELSLDELKELYCNHDRARLGPPAPASGLYLMKVMY